MARCRWAAARRSRARLPSSTSRKPTPGWPPPARLPPSSSSDSSSEPGRHSGQRRCALPLAGAGGIRALHRHQLPGPRHALRPGAGIATGLTSGLGGLVGCRAVLGVAEAAGIPAAGKAIHQYLRPGERALGNAVNQAGVSLGSVVAPLLATWIALRSGWRHAFVVTGVLGLAWIPLWLWVSRRAPAAPLPAQPRGADAAMLRDRRLWVFAAANALSMVGYFFWFFWTSKYMVDVYRLTLQQAAWYVWIPPVFACCGGFLGGWLSLRFCDPRRGAPGRALPRVPGGRRGFSGHCRPAVGDFARVGRGRNFA